MKNKQSKKNNKGGGSRSSLIIKPRELDEKAVGRNEAQHPQTTADRRVIRVRARGVGRRRGRPRRASRRASRRPRRTLRPHRDARRLEPRRFKNDVRSPLRAPSKNDLRAPSFVFFVKALLILNMQIIMHRSNIT